LFGGTLVWNGASTKIADAGANDFVLSADAFSTLEVGGNRLYGGTSGTPLAVWNDLGTTSSPRASDFSLTIDGGSIADERVFGDTLVVTIRNQPNGVVRIYKMISGTGADRAPVFTVAHPTIGTVTKSLLGTDGTLYVLDSDGVSIFGDALTAPTFKAELKSGLVAPDDILLME
jgi:hypothetical protein